MTRSARSAPRRAGAQPRASKLRRGPAHEVLRRHRAGLARYLASALEQRKGGNAADVELGAERLFRLGIHFDQAYPGFEHVRDMAEIMKYPVLGTPALVVDGEVKVAGRMPSKDELARWLGKA